VGEKIGQIKLYKDHDFSTNKNKNKNKINWSDEIGRLRWATKKIVYVIIFVLLGGKVHKIK